MSVIVTDAGFRPATEVQAVTLADVAAHQGALDLAHTDDPELVAPYLAALSLIRVSFPAFNDGRAFTVARRLRMLGYRGELRATGPVIADQYAMARRVGFDAVEIPDELAARQPEDQWKFRADWRQHDYQSRLRA
ncbi:MAG: DUF934 domain-containing protein [Tabrizicola sp.]|uniref:DUF934 domain-containing protein n=1 Tax=Tabrizicola sp. TaxID=2005166 RepID=UPI0027349375|nr:DUF934 domain-containing protein [Tabrizicola sp.]MDP3263003.1 DUF934 domain-containing protein [Tabrizicola sp.]MDP3649328.1 DUF934 domain-containing protein [Paracoccaceae bacterium]MDZ4067268.1 DUF934 domain-containing protein [Tabrizicola sp.]